MQFSYVLKQKKIKYKPLVIAFGCLLGQLVGLSQEKAPIQFGRITQQDFDLPNSKVIDSNTDAVIIADIGTTSFEGNKMGWVSYIFKRQTRIKILNKKAFDLATVEIPLYSKDENSEKLKDLIASTFNIENGRVVESKLAKKELYEDKHDKNHFVKKFTLPALKEGSIIEYSYTIHSDFTFNLPEWEFQYITHPCLWSEYEVTIPSILTYVFLTQGYDTYYINKADQGNQVYHITDPPESGGALGATPQEYSVSAYTVKHRWVMKEVPALSLTRMDRYISTPRNYIDKIEFQLSQISTNGRTNSEVTSTWKKATEELLNEDNFGKPLREDNSWMKNELDIITIGATDELDKAKKIYYFASRNLTCTGHYDKYIKTTLKDVFKRRSGNAGEINLLLAAMLRQNSISADPVLLSTKDFGYNLINYPLLTKLNFVICRTKINGKIYYLDASDPLLGFGALSFNCYNGPARIISETDSGSVYFYADSLKEKKMTSVIIINDKNGIQSGSFQSTLGNVESYELRERIKAKGEKEFFKGIQAAYGSELELENARIDSLSKLENPVMIFYDFNFKAGQNEDLIYFNPMLSESVGENPFTALERKYPVEMPYAPDEVYTLIMDIPSGYTVDEIPKSVKVSLNGTEGFFEYQIEKNENNIQLISHIKLNKANFAREDYAVLRDFYAYIVKKQREQIVFKKKK
jgi:Domain of Unknown Function with PDB structure (DUF3858)/Domain of Unknown Function with PDB structure (DUF3857)/Transglutaminase-like superfamily